VVETKTKKEIHTMNRSSLCTQPFDKAITSFLFFKSAEGLLDHTIYSYQYILNQCLEYWGAVDVASVTSQKVSEYLSWLRTDYVPKRFNGKTDPLSPKTIRNVWITLSAFFTWAGKEYNFDSPMKGVPPPRFQKVPVATFTQEDVRAMLKACLYSREADTNMRRRFAMRRPTAKRDQAIVLVLLDSGVRASELCRMTIGDLDVKHGKMDIKHGVGGGAKGGKGRTVYLGKVTRQAVWRYLQDREDGQDPDAPLFVVSGIRPFNPGSLRQLIQRIGERAGVPNVYPHKFRHTFALTYLRSGGDVFTLQSLLGHSSLDMVRYYAQIAQVDVEQAHRRASPADNWRL
jgi:integrase/recombinase XerD